MSFDLHWGSTFTDPAGASAVALTGVTNVPNASAPTSMSFERHDLNAGKNNLLIVEHPPRLLQETLRR
ncbi:hypothetical protein D3C85_969110 [compost metagenome]